MVDLRPDQLAIVQGILKAEVPDIEVWAFGSRARWTSGENSDLDLVLRSERPLAGSVLNRLRELFEGSYLPFSVDVVDWAHLDEDFQAVIEAEKVAISIPRNGGTRGHFGSPWRAMPLSECADFLSGGTPSKSQPELWEGTIPWISAKDMKQLRLHDAEDHVSSEAIGNGTRIVPAGTVLMLVRGMTLHKDLPICITDTEMAFNQDVKALVPRLGIEPLFLAYSLLGNKPALLTLVDSASHGTGRIHSGALQSFPIAVPPLPEQRAIAHILGTLDDKIELNRRMNETLEAMARALFKSWFVDFDPVRAKAEGRDPGLPKHLADLFPDSFEDSELGEIPKGWDATTWGAMVTLEYGKALRGYSEAEGAWPVFGTNGRIGRHSQPLCKHAGIIIGRKGAYRGVHYCSSPFFVIDTAFYVEPKTQLELRWAYYQLLEMDINSMDSGSAIPSTSRDDFYGCTVVAPPQKIQKYFVEILSPVWARQEENNLATATLTSLRDTFLPKLISGEIRLKDAERFVAANL